MQEEPDEAGQFSSDSDDGLGSWLAAGDEPAVPAVKTCLSAIGDGDDALRLSLAAASKRKTHGGAMTIVPGSLDEETADVVVACTSNGTSTAGIAARVFTRDEPEVAHEGAWGAEAAEVVEFGDHGDGGDGVDAAEAAKPADGFLVGFLGGDLSEGRVDVRKPLLELVDGDEVSVERRSARAIIEGERVKPRHVARTPRSLGPGEETVASKQELAHAMPRTSEVLLDILPAAAEVSKRFLGLSGRADFGEEVRSQELGEFASISAIGLDARAGLRRSQGRRDHDAADTEGAELTLQGIARGSRLVAADQIPSRISQETPGKAPDRFILVRLLPLDRSSAVRPQHRDLDRTLVNIEPDVCHNLRGHDRLLSYAALAPLALTRDRAWRLIRHRVDVLRSRRVNLTTASRSFHTV